MKKENIYTSTDYNYIIKEVDKIIKEKRKNGVYQKLLDETLDKITKHELTNKEYKILFIYEILKKFNFIYKLYYKLLSLKITSIIIKKIKMIIKIILRNIFY